MDQRARIDQPLHHRRAFPGHMIRIEQRAIGRDLSGHHILILQDSRNAVKDARILSRGHIAGLGFPGLVQRFVAIGETDRIQAGGAVRDPCQQIANNLNRRNFPVAIEAEQIRCAEPGKGVSLMRNPP